MDSSYEKEGHSTTIGVVDGMAWFEDGTSVDAVTVELIAAAPDLLAAACRLLDYFDSPDDHPDCIKDDVLIRLREVVGDATNPIAWKKEES